MGAQVVRYALRALGGLHAVSEYDSGLLVSTRSVTQCRHGGHRDVHAARARLVDIVSHRGSSAARMIHSADPRLACSPAGGTKAVHAHEARQRLAAGEVLCAVRSGGGEQAVEAFRMIMRSMHTLLLPTHEC